MKFPTEIENFHRKSITSFNKELSNISVEYKSVNHQENTHFTIYIYPAGVGFEDRLYDEYVLSLQAIANVANKEIKARQGPFYYTNNGYSFVGIRARTGNLKNTVQSMLIIFECGEYFLKYRIDTDQQNNDNLDSLSNQLFEIFNPSDIVNKYPLIPSSNIIVAPAAFKDSLTLYSVLAGAYSLSGWALENIDSLERCSGFPGMYLDGRTETFLEMTESWVDNSKGFKRYPNDYFESLVKIVEKGYLEEFLMDEYSMLLLSSDSINFEFENYFKWKEEILPHFNLIQRYFIINYDK